MATAIVPNQTGPHDESDFPRPTAILDLSPELILEVVEWLQPIDILCLYCAHQQFHDIIHVNRDKISFSRVASPENTESLLPRLAKDVPQYILCYVCLNLYLQSPEPTFSSLGPMHCSTCRQMKVRCVNCHFTEGSVGALRHMIGLADFRIGYQIEWENVRNFPFEAVLEKVPYPLPSCGMPTRSGLNTSIHWNAHSNRFSLTSAEARPHPIWKDLFVRIQHVDYISKRKMRSAVREAWEYRVCTHTPKSSWGLGLDIPFFWRTYSKKTTGPYNMRECACCGTVYALDIKKRRHKEWAIIVTKWTGLSLMSPADIKSNIEIWPAHSARLGYYRRIPGKDPNPKGGFDTAPGDMTYEELVIHNMSELKAKAGV